MHFDGLNETPVASQCASVGNKSVAVSFEAFASDGFKFDGSVLMDSELATSAATVPADPGAVDAPEATTPTRTAVPTTADTTDVRMTLAFIAVLQILRAGS
jgi:hypothetical protein